MHFSIFMMYFIHNEDTVNKIHHKDQSAFVGYLYILDFFMFWFII